MAFLNQLSEKLEAQAIYDGMKGKYETRFKVNGMEYAFLANTMAGDCNDNAQWMIEFENTTSHRIGYGDNDPKIVKAFGEAIGQWIKERAPVNFYTYGSHCDSIKNIIAAVKKQAKGYELVDDTADKKNEENGEVIEGNPVGKITWTKVLVQDTVPVVDTVDREAINGDEFESEYELPKDIKTNKAFMSGTKNSDKLDNGDKAYDLKTESAKDVDYFVKKFKDKMKGSSHQTAIGWVNGIKELSKEDKDAIKKKLGLVKESESFAEFKAKKLGLVTESLNEGVGNNLAKLASAAIRKLSDKVKGAWKKVTEIAGSEESLKKWVDENKEELAHAMDIAKHMMDKKQLTFEGTEVSYSMLQENLLDLVAQKTPNVLTAAILILSIMGSGQKVFGANDSGSEAMNKIKKNAKEIVEIVKHQGDQVGKNVIKDIEKAKKDLEKEAKAKAEEAKKAAKDKTDDLKDKAKDKGDEVKDKANQFGQEVKVKANQFGKDASEKGKEAMDKANQFGKDVADKATEKGKEIGQKVNQKIGNFADKLGQKASEVAPEIEKKAGEVGDAVKKKATDKADQLKQGFQKFMQQKKEVKKDIKPTKQAPRINPRSMA